MTRKRSQNISPQVRRPSGRLAMILGSLGVMAACVAIRYYWGAESASADSPSPRTSSVRTSPARATLSKPVPAPVRPAAGQSATKQRVVATVNGHQISRSDLGRECLRHYGKDVLESTVNKQLIIQECKRRGITVTRAEVDAEVERMAGRFGLPKEQWLKMLKTERGINPAQYAADIVWPTLALRRLAGKHLEVTQAELVKAYDAKYGPKVRARLIACKDAAKAKRLHAAAVKDPDEFGNLAKDYSEDTPSAAAKGLIQPIRKHGTYKEIEQAAFSMADGEISDVIPAGGQYVIIKRESLMPGAKTVNFQQVVPQLEEMIRDGKLRKVANEVFQQLQDRAEVQNVLNDPKLSRAMPGVAAVVNGHRVGVEELAEQCIARHGPEVLEGTINRMLLEQACRKQNLTVTEQEIDEEIVRAAAESVKPKADGSPDVEAWLKLVTEQQGVSVDVYRRDSVWPSVALRKLVGDTVDVTKEDMRKGFESNYQPRVRCRAIVMNNLRRANKVWEMARERPTVEHFGDLAEQYSSDPTSAALRGEVPPIKKYSGQPLMEKEAFALKPGQLSGVIQVADRFVILFCEGYTKPNDISFEEVRDFIYDDIYEKKLRIAMGRYFRRLQENATIDNYLAGTSQRPKATAGPKPPPYLPTLQAVPGR